jgi:hypothetical protein
MFMYEGIVGNRGNSIDKLEDSDSLTRAELADLQKDLSPLISIIKNEENPFS